MGLWHEAVKNGLMARGSIRWAHGTRQYKVGLWHETVNDGLMARHSIGWAYGTRQCKVGLGTRQ
jgi:hypothetical protein